MCGEKFIIETALSIRLGSPPRVRGKAVRLSVRIPFIRITPACAGKSLYLVRRYTGDEGSPPRVRGKVAIKRGHANGEGITPACAGKSKTLRGFLYIFEDHPRVCGEKYKSERDR